MEIVAELNVGSNLYPKHVCNVLLQKAHVHGVRTKGSPNHVIAAVAHSHVNFTFVQPKVDVGVARDVYVLVPLYQVRFRIPHIQNATAVVRVRL